MFKQFFIPLTAEQIAHKQLATAKCDLLAMQAQAEYSAKMVEYHQQKIRRLTAYLEQDKKPVIGLASQRASL